MTTCDFYPPGSPSVTRSTGPPTFNPLAGFAHAKGPDRTPVIVQPGIASVDGAVRYWNRRAGWSLLVIGSPTDYHHLRFEEGPWSCGWSGPPPYDYATIYHRDGPWQPFAHEMGHGLGADHQPHGIVAAPAKFGRKARRFDKKLMAVAGYRS